MTGTGYKTVNTSVDGSTWYTLPGQSGEWDDTLGTMDDTVFGQGYKSSQPGLIEAKLTANAYYKGFAGYNATVKAVGTSTLMTGEALTLVSTGIYQITNAAHQVLDRANTFTVKDNTTDVTSHVLSIDYLFGIINITGYSPTGTLTVTAHYLPMTALAKYQTFTLTQTLDTIETSDLPTMQTNSGIRTYSAGLKTVSMQVDGIYSNSSPVYRGYITGRTEVVIEICPDGSGKTVARGFFKAASRKQSGNVGALEVESVTFNLFVPTSLTLSAGNAVLKSPFGWQFTSTDLNMSVQQVLNAFTAGSSLYVQYLPDGGTTSGAGLQAVSSIVTDCSLSGGFDSMNMFNATFQISGAVTTV